MSAAWTPVSPVGLSAADWFDSMNPVLEQYGPIFILNDPELWRDWAMYVVNLPGVAILSPPNPAVFTDWREWAQRFVEVLS